MSMSNTPTIESRNLNISDLFKDFYTVPNFQREYVWNKDNVIQLLEDIFEGLGLYEDEPNNTEYFLGSIVVCPDDVEDDKKTFQLIDGQQRLTTIYLIFCSLRDSIKKLGDTSKAIEDLIMGVAQDINTGEDIDKYRLLLQYDTNGAKVLDNILAQKQITQDLKYSSQSAKNIFTAWEEIKQFLSENLEDNPKKLKLCSSTIANKVKLIRIETPNLKNALKVFETLNERGVGLSPVDLLKNYLFIHTAKDIDRDKHWKILTEKWQSFLDLLYKNDQTPLQFLRYYLISHYKVDLQNNFPEEEIYEWFLNQGENNQITKNPLKFLEELIISANHYCLFTKAKNPDGTDNKYLKNITKIQGRTRQHFILLLGGRFLNRELFEQLSSYVEKILFVHTITRKTRRKDINLTREFAKWASKLRKVKNSQELDQFLNDNLLSELESLRSDFEVAISQISTSNLAKFRLRYMLARIDQFVEEKITGNPKSIDWYLDKNITIEHISPQSKNASLTQNLGNLTLLEKSINSSVGKKPYDQKKLDYKQSQILITRTLVELPKVGQDTKFNRGIKELGLENFTAWDDKSIEKRKKFLVHISSKVWIED